MDCLQTKYGTFMIVDWDRGTDEYGEDFIEMAMQFVNDLLLQFLNQCLQGAQSDNWAQFLYNIHKILGSSGYACALQLQEVCKDAQDYLLPHIVKVNPKGKLPEEIYEVKATFTGQQKYESLQYLQAVIEASIKLCQEFVLKGQKIDTTKFIEISNATQPLLQQYRQSAYGVSHSIISVKTHTKQGFDKSSPRNSQYNINRQPSNGQLNIKTDTQMSIDRPKESSCCSQCRIW